MGLFFALCFLLLAVSKAEYEDCADKLSVLEKAMFDTKNNQKNLSFGFFPSRQRSSRYLEVIYEFSKENEYDEDCIVTYFWSIGTFLFIQPPRVLQFTSLYFSFPANDIDNITLTLPSECRPLVYNNKTGRCSCKDPGDTLLDILTRHLLEYAKYIPGQIVRNELSTARAICDEELKEAYYDNDPVILYFFFVILISPISAAFSLLLIFRTNSENIKLIIEKKQSHPNLAGIFLTAVYAAFYATIMKVLGMKYTGSSSHEYKNYNLGRTFNFVIVYVSTIVVDIPVVLVWILVVLIVYSRKADYKIFKCCWCDINKKLKQIHEYTVAPSLYEVRYILWIGFPVIAVSSHVGYIIIAWLTEPEKTSSTFLIMLCALFFLFATFRALYTFSSENIAKNSSCCGLWFAFLVGIFAVALTSCYIAIFIIIPVPAYELANYFENIIRIILILAAGLITYKVLSFEHNDAKKFLRSFKEKLKHIPTTDEHEDEFKYSGAMLGIVFNYIISHVEKNAELKTVDIENLISVFNAAKTVKNEYVSLPRTDALSKLSKRLQLGQVDMSVTEYVNALMELQCWLEEDTRKDEKELDTIRKNEKPVE